MKTRSSRPGKAVIDPVAAPNAARAASDELSCFEFSNRIVLERQLTPLEAISSTEADRIASGTEISTMPQRWYARQSCVGVPAPMEFAIRLASRNEVERTGPSRSS